MKTKLGLIVMIIIIGLCSVSNLLANEISEEEKGKKNEKTKSLVGFPPIKANSWYLNIIQEKIKKKQKLTCDLLEVPLYYVVTRNKYKDVSELKLLLKFIKYGDNDAIKMAIEILPISVKKNLSEIKEMDYDYFYNLLKPFVNSQYAALIVESCASIYKISKIYHRSFDDSLLSKLEYYARGTDSENWNLAHTLIYRDYNPDSDSYKRICEEKKIDREEYVKYRAINEIRRKVIRCLFLMNNSKADKLLIEIMENENKSSDINRLIRILWEKRENGDKLYNMNSNNRDEEKDTNWNGFLSAAYCDSMYNRYNPQYNIYNPDCASFGSQCLIAGGLNLRDLGGSAYIADTNGVISSVPLLHRYLSSRPDVKSEKVNFYSHQSWNPNEHIPNWFTTGDIAILGVYVISPTIHTIINHGGSGSAARFGAHSQSIHDSLLSHWIKLPYDGSHFDYVTFFHILNTEQTGTQIPGGNINGIWIEENSPYYVNGDITIPQGSQLNIEAGTYIEFTGNYKLVVEGDLIVSGSEAELVTFTANDTTVGWGGIRFYHSSNSSLNYADISYVVNHSHDDYFANPWGVNFYGAGSVFCAYSPVTFDHCKFFNNNAYAGGAIFAINNSNLSVTNCEFYNNTGSDMGGAIVFLSKSNMDYPYLYPFLSQNIFYNNHCGYYNGGAIYAENKVTAYLIHSTITKNNAVGGNHGFGPSSLFLSEGSNFYAYDNVIWKADEDRIAIYDSYSNIGTNVNVYHSDITGGNQGYSIKTDGYSLGNFYADNRVIGEDPLFSDYENNDFSLQPLSPCIDGGGSYSVLNFPSNFPESLKRRIRESLSRTNDPDGTVPDMGAISYYQPDHVNQPTNLTITHTAEGNIQLSWDEAEGAIFYAVQSSDTPYGNFVTIKDTLRALTYTDTLPQAKRFYKVIGKNNRTRRGAITKIGY